METGFVVEGHLHNFDHVTIFQSGRWRVGRRAEDGRELPSIEMQGGYPSSFLLIEKNVWHRLECISGPGSYMCVYPHREEAGLVVEVSTGWEAAYGIPERDLANRNPHIAQGS